MAVRPPLGMKDLEGSLWRKRGLWLALQELRLADNCRRGDQDRGYMALYMLAENQIAWKTRLDSGEIQNPGSWLPRVAGLKED